MNIEVLRESARTITRDLAWREQQLEAILGLLTDGAGDLIAALAEDLGRPAAESMTADILPSMLEAQLARTALREWAADRPADVADIWQPAEAFVRPEPLGVVLVIGPWNFPVQLVLEPLIAAIAAGNAVVIKPSELAPATSTVLARELASRMDQRAVAVVEGGADVAQSLLAERFDHIFYTGSTAVGRIVAKAAAEHLTPTTLELGGKCPTYVDESADIAAAGQRLAWTKLMNAGQICLAPDHVLAHRSIADELINEIKTAIKTMYGDDPADSGDFVKIVNERHVKRLIDLRDGVGSGTIVHGGAHDVGQRYVEPTILRDPAPTSAIMQEEIFGPLLPVITVDDLDDAVSWTAGRPKPLAAYIFTADRAQADEWIARVPAGGACVNATIMHSLPSTLPFGGVGESGLGAYHGQHGFDQLSHLRSVLVKPAADDLSAFMPPYGPAQ